jgi:putative phosphoserine phosphatase/1-acylglycerol-3-phosphate O-acyltransferase
VIPIGIWGTEKVWPRSSRLPNVLNVLTPPDVTITVGAPVPLTHRSADADTKRIMKAIMALLPADSRIKRTPTEEEIALALPPGYHGDMKAETVRRPGTD